MKKIIIKILQGLFSPKNIFLKTKDTVFCNPSEHLFRVVDYISLHYNNKTHLPILDIGAADGGTADYFSNHFNRATIIAFEPIKQMFGLAQKTNSENKNVTVKNIGLYDKVGKQEINITKNFLSSSINDFNAHEVSNDNHVQQSKYHIIEKQEITTSTLDEETKILKEILLIKIDTQGTELTIFKHGTETLKKTHLVLVEMNNHQLYKDGTQYYEMDEFLRAQNFKLVDIIVTYRPKGAMQEYDALYRNTQLN